MDPGRPSGNGPGVHAHRAMACASSMPDTAPWVNSRGQVSGMLLDRSSECQFLDQLIADVRAGESRALVVRGEAGVGKTALLDSLAQRASGCRIVRAGGAESEMELPFAGVHQLCASMLKQVDRLPAPQRDALSTAFGLSAGNPPDRFLVGLARTRPGRRSGPGPTAGVRLGRRSVAGSGIGSDARLGRSSAAGRVGRDDLRGARVAHGRAG